MIHQMQRQGLIEVEPGGNLLFTAKGSERVDGLSERIRFFRQVLTDAGVEPSLALQGAVSFSWEMSEASFQALKNRACPPMNLLWGMRHFGKQV